MTENIYDLIKYQESVRIAQERYANTICEECDKKAVRIFECTCEDDEDSGSDRGESWGYCFDHLSPADQRDFLKNSQLKPKS